MVKFIVLAGLICSNFSFSSVLSSAAAKLKPETWGFINSNLGYDMIHAGPTMDIIWAYGSRCHWNSQTKQILYIGSAHGAPSNFIIYTDSTNSWRLEGTCRDPQTSTNRFGHSYDLRAFDTHTNKYWIHTYNGPSYLFTYHSATNTWDSVAPLGTFDQSNTNSIGYFPDIKKIVAYSGKDGSIKTLDPVTKSWTHIRSAAANGFEVVICYNQKFRCMVLGGGENSTGSLYALDTNLQLTTLTAAPVRIGAMGSEMTCDPGSGDILVSTGVTIRAFSMTSKTWRTIPISPASLSNFDITGAKSIIGTIPEYNCHVLLNTSGYGMLIYKHSHDSNMISAEKVSVYSKSHPLLAANPNPFTGNVKITMSGLATSSGQMNIYNAQGKLVRSIHVQNQSAVWDGRNNECVRLPEGTYMGVFTSGSFKLSIRLCLMH